MGQQNEYQFSLGLNRHTMWHMSPVSIILQIRLMSGWDIQKWRPVLLC